LSQRDQRIKRLAELYGPANWMLPAYEAGAKDRLSPGGASVDVVFDLIMEQAVFPWITGKIPLQTARFRLLRRSPSLFVSLLPDLQVHHGDADDKVILENSLDLESALRNLGPSAPSFQFFIYPGGQHSPTQLPGCGKEIEAFLAGVMG